MASSRFFFLPALDDKKKRSLLPLSLMFFQLVLLDKLLSKPGCDSGTTMRIDIGFDFLLIKQIPWGRNIFAKFG